MQVSFVQALALLAASGSVVASPVPSLFGSFEGILSGLEGAGEVAGEVQPEIEAIEQVVEEVIDLIKGIQDLIDQHDIESKFTQSTVSKLGAQYPNKNIMVYGDSSSANTFVNPACSQKDCDIGLGFSKSYQVCIFDSGSFDRNGDGGYVNWAFEGNYKRDDGSAHVDFFPMGATTPSKKRDDAAPKITFDFTAQPGQNHSHVPLHAPVVYTPPPAPAAMLPPSTPIPSKNNNDGNYLLNCHAGNGTTAHAVAYYKIVVPHGGNKGQQPDDFTLLAETTPKVKTGGFQNATTVEHSEWRFPVGAMEFQDTQTWFHWSIFGNSASNNVTADETAGFANNGNDFFWIYKDETTSLFMKDGWTCDSLYYAF